MKRKVKKAVFIAGIITVTVVSFFSCTMEAETRTGSITLTVPASGDTGETRGPQSGRDYARVYLLFNREMFRLGSRSDYREFELSGNQRKVTVENIPAGGPYKLWLGIGQYISNGDFLAYDVRYYAESGDFTVIPDKDNYVRVDLLPSPFIKAQSILGRYVGGAAVVESLTPPIYAATRTNVYRGTFDAVPDPDTLTMTVHSQSFSGYMINSLTEGYRYTGGAPPACLYINTNRNVIVWNGVDSFDDTLMSNLGTINILRSLAYYDGSNVSFFFQRNGGLGGVDWDQAIPAQNVWVNVNYGRYFKGEIVHDFVVTGDAVYFATALGAFLVPQSLIDTYVAPAKVNLLRVASFFKVRQGKRELYIYALGYNGANTLYAGTEDGLWSINIPTMFSGGTPALVPGTEHNRIYMAESNGTYTAYASKTYLYIQDSGGNLVATYPFVAGLPGDVTSMDWEVNTLIISGTEGLVALPL